jgi:hypothetical protein
VTRRIHQRFPGVAISLGKEMISATHIGTVSRREQPRWRIGHLTYGT